jgi:hypothetical protein
MLTASVWLKRVAALQVGDGDLALATAPLHARGLFETLRAYL